MQSFPSREIMAAQHLRAANTIKEKADSWKDLTHPNLHNLAGS